jgi:SAM-dependent methyltransferase
MSGEMSDSATALDGAAYFDGECLRNVLYDVLYLNAMDASGDKAFLKSLAAGATDILDAACGTGRRFTSLARPGRRIEAFDASAVMLRQAEARAQKLRHLVPIGVSRQRLESFSYPKQFDLIILAWYGFNCLLQASDRAACLQRIAAHLKPGGRAVLHMPAPALLTREVPPHEIAAQRSVMTLPQQNGLKLQLEHAVTAMDYEPARALRSIHIELHLRDEAGKVLHTERDILRYACVTAPELELAALDAGLALCDLRSGFGAGSNAELVAVLQQRGFSTQVFA